MRQKIVINLDQPGTGGTKPVRKRRRWPRVLGILALLMLLFVVVAAVGGYFAWRRYQSSPIYALALMLDAAQRNDVAEFQKRIDDEAIAKNMTAAVSQKAAARYGQAIDSSTQQKIDSTMPSLLPRVKQTVHDEFLNAMKTPEQRSFLSIVGAVQSMMIVTTNGDAAKATGKLAGRDIELGMRRDPDGWKVIDVKDDVIVQRVVDSVMKDLPAIGSGDTEFPFMKKAKPRRSRRGR
jgi:hypothetical protein